MIRLSGLVLALALLASALVACSGSPAARTTRAGASGDAPRGVTLTLWDTALDTPALKSLYAAYEAASGNKINLITYPPTSYEATVATKWATGVRPDLLEWHAGLGQLAPLDPTDKMVDLSNLPFVQREGNLAKSSGAMDGKVYGATLGPLTEFGIFFNKQVLVQAGLQPPASFADLARDCTVLHQREPDVTPIFEAGGDGWPTQILSGILYETDANQNGAYTDGLLARTHSLTDPAGSFIKGLQAYDGLKKSGCFNSDASTAKFTDSVQAVLSGKAAMVAQNSSDFISQAEADVAHTTTNPASVLGFTGVSANDARVSSSPSIIGTYYVPRTGNTVKQRAAVAFVDWITGPGYQQYLNDAGARPTETGFITPPQTGLWAEVARAYNAGSAPCWTTSLPGGASLSQFTNQVLVGQIDPTQAAQKMSVAFEEAAALLH